MRDIAPTSKHAPWGAALCLAIVVTVLILRFYTWFAVAGRYAVFLYGHVTTNIPASEPFGRETSTRYWMSGLVAAGLVLLLNTAWQGIRTRFAAWRGSTYLPSAWWRVWALCALPVMVGILLITMTCNAPTLPLGLALACVVATLAGLAVALYLSMMAGGRLRALLWLAADGLGLLPPLLLIRALELPGRGLSVNMTVAVFFSVGGTIAGALWLGLMTLLRRWRRQPAPSALDIGMAGLAWSYLLMPVAHHFSATPPAYRYISSASNFFAFNPLLQFAALAVAAGLAWGVTALRRVRRSWADGEEQG